MAQVYAQPYGMEHKGFYFEDYSDFVEKYNKNINRMTGQPVEEYMFEFISGSDEANELFKMMQVDQGNLEEYYDLVDTLDPEDLPKLAYLVDVLDLSLERALENVENLYVYEGKAKDYVEEEFIPTFYDVERLDELHPSNLDLKLLGRTFHHYTARYNDELPNDTDYKVGEYILEHILEGDIGHIRFVADDSSADPFYFFDSEHIAEMLENGQEIDEFTYGGNTYTITNLYEEFRNNPALCNEGTISSSGEKQKMSEDWQYEYDNDKMHARGVCTYHGGVKKLLTDKQYRKYSPSSLPKYGAKKGGKSKMVEYREERHPKIKKAIELYGKKKKKKNPAILDNWTAPNHQPHYLGFGYYKVESQDELNTEPNEYGLEVGSILERKDVEPFRREPFVFLGTLKRQPNLFVLQNQMFKSEPAYTVTPDMLENHWQYKNRSNPAILLHAPLHAGGKFHHEPHPLGFGYYEIENENDLDTTSNNKYGLEVGSILVRSDLEPYQQEPYIFLGTLTRQPNLFVLKNQRFQSEPLFTVTSDMLENYWQYKNRSNPAICNAKDPVTGKNIISSSGAVKKMGSKWQSSYGDADHLRGVCTYHGGVKKVISEKEYKKLKPQLMKKYGAKKAGSDGLVPYRHERHPKLTTLIKAHKAKKKAKKKSKE